jgi:hypothetical protein
MRLYASISSNVADSCATLSHYVADKQISMTHGRILLTAHDCHSVSANTLLQSSYSLEKRSRVRYTVV